MAEYKHDPTRKPLYLYSLPDNVISTLVPKNITSSASASTEDETRQYDDDVSDTASTAGSVSSTAQTDRTCALCNMDFPTGLDKRGHLKADLHYYNLKQKIRGLSSVTEAEFEKLADGMDESLSGSDWSESSDSEADTKHTDKKAGGLASLLQKQAVISSARQKAAAARKKNKGSDDLDDEEGDEQPDGKPRTTREKREAAEATASLQPFVWFSSPTLPENNYFGVYRAMLTPEELNGTNTDEKDDDAAWSTRMATAISTRQLAPISGATAAATATAIPSTSAAASDAATPAPVSIPAGYNGRHIFLCMIGGGHFAAMVIALPARRNKTANVPMNREATVLAHKTFHRYTTRRKQGGSQSANDNSKGTAHSAGSSLRRYNEQALIDDVRGLLRDWKPLLDTADLLFVRANGNTNQRTLFGPYEGQVMHLRDPRLRNFPFNTRRATQNEIMRAFIELTRLKVREIVPQGAGAEAGTAPVLDEAALAERQKQKEEAARRKAVAAKQKEEEDTALLHTSQLQGLARRSKVPALLSYLKSNDLAAATFRFFPPDAPQNHHAPTLLHFAASQNAPTLVSALLLRVGADPTVLNGDGKTAFELAGDRPTRNAFRVARSELPASAGIDWDAARVPLPMTRAEADQREAREKEEAERKEAERRRTEAARLKKETDTDNAGSNSAAGRKKKALPVKSAQEMREEEARGLTPEQRMRLERERRARAAEARMRQAQGGN
ncbi:ankyrin repeat-containing protein [Ophiostoma piceae UAMH 11346]|uniref:Ankyrin repeat-containing protein n=1 Tax=Ophiostoma piceae (strain UAMH 11346) TaxID=1262450 RepID=S3C7T5_OPHP1|nr:ankyrin repeat-containing protein [Ophiostoma piceae UAMH 11346]